MIKPVAIVNVSWSADHRVIDGATIGKLCYDGDCYTTIGSKISDSYHVSDDDHSNDDNNNYYYYYSQILECLEAAYRASRNDADDSSLVDSPTK